MSKYEVRAIEEIRSSISVVPWTRLAHAYHGAWDAPEMLEMFVDSESEEALAQAVGWMWGSILHQGSIYSASIPAIWILVDLLAIRPNHPATPSILRAVQIISDGLNYFSDYEEPMSPVLKSGSGEPLYEVRTHKALPTSVDDVVDDDEYFTACIVTPSQLRTLVKHAIPVICSCLKCTDIATRSAAVVAGLGALQVVPDNAELRNLFEVIEDLTYDPGTWISVAMVFGQLGENISPLLKHSDRRVRLAAAMSTSTMENEESIKELASALSEPEWLEAEFPNNAAHIDMHLRFHVLAALLKRVEPETVTSFVVDSICTLIRKRSGKYTVDAEWGPILHWAFKNRLISLPRIGDPEPLPDMLTETQAAILQALCLKAELWDPTNGNASLAYMRVQLPYDHKILYRLINEC